MGPENAGLHVLPTDGNGRKRRKKDRKRERATLPDQRISRVMGKGESSSLENVTKNGPGKGRKGYGSTDLRLYKSTKLKIANYWLYSLMHKKTKFIFK
jgi:hypothetical protein